MMSSVASAMCWTPGPLYASRYSSICDFRLPCAGSLMGNLMRSLPLAITFDINEEYSVLMVLSSKVSRFRNPITWA